MPATGQGLGPLFRRPAGGLTSALDPVMQALGGTWVAWGSGEADAAAVDREDRVGVPPGDPRYTLRRIWLTDHDIHRYYLGFSRRCTWYVASQVDENGVLLLSEFAGAAEEMAEADAHALPEHAGIA